MAQDQSENLAHAHHYLAHAKDLGSRAQQGGEPHPDTAARIGIGYALLALIDEVDELRKQLRDG
jgi:hypothetical protein